MPLLQSLRRVREERGVWLTEGSQERSLGDLRALFSGMDRVHEGGAHRTAIRIHLADDHTLFREGLEALLASRGDGIEVVGRSSTAGDDAIALVGRNKPLV